MLSQHPAFFGFPELNLAATETLGELLVLWKRMATLFRSEFPAGLGRALAHVEFGEQSSAGLLWAREWMEARRHWTTAEVWDFLAAAVRPRSVVEKSPLVVFQSDRIQRAIRHGRGAALIHLSRHPVAAVRSMQRTYRKEGAAGARECLHAWTIGQRNILEATQGEALVWRVRGEDLLEDPHSLWPRFFQLLGMELSKGDLEAMLHPERWEFARVGPAEAAYANDDHFLKAPVLRVGRQGGAESLATGMAALGVKEVPEAALEVAQTLGYA
jgi:Sulfotransferase family